MPTVAKRGKNRFVENEEKKMENAPIIAIFKTLKKRARKIFSHEIGITGG